MPLVMCTCKLLARHGAITLSPLLLTHLSCYPCVYQALEGANPRAVGYDTMMTEMITEAERNAHKPPQRLIFMACLSRLMPQLMLYTVKYLSRLMPLLLEWLHAHDEPTRGITLATLAEVMRSCWPRMAVHAELIVEHLHAVDRAEKQQSRRAGKGAAGSADQSNGSTMDDVRDNGGEQTVVPGSTALLQQVFGLAQQLLEMANKGTAICTSEQQSGSAYTRGCRLVQELPG